MVDGFKAAVDPASLDVGGVRETVMAGRSVYGTQTRMSFGKTPSLDLKGLRRLTASTLGAHLREANTVLGEHVCGSRAFSSVPIDAPTKALSAPVCDLRRRGGWVPPQTCPRSSGVPFCDAPTSCQACDPPPFEPSPGAVAVLETMDPWATPAELLRDHLGATVISIDIGGRNVYTRP